MKKIILLLSIFISMKSIAQVDYDRINDKENGSLIFKGIIDFQEIINEPEFGWFQSGVETYIPHAETIDRLRDRLPRYNLVIILGTWCEDSQNLIPKLYKILQQAAYPIEQVKVIGVDRNKEGKNGEHKEYHAERVPSIIVFRENTEIGRIIESVKESIEKDLDLITAEGEE